MLGIEYKIARHIGERIRSQRKLQGMTRAELSKLICATSTAPTGSTISNWEQGYTCPSAAMLLLIAVVQHQPIEFYLSMDQLKEEKSHAGFCELESSGSL